MTTYTTSIQIWEEHSDRLKAFICSKVKGEDHCHDILQELFLKITEKEERIKLIEQPASYLIKMAQNSIMDYYRAQKKSIEQLQAYKCTNIDEHLSDIQLADCCLISFIKNLPPIYNEALILTELEGLSQKQLARQLNISYSGAKSRIQRARKLLKDSILACCPYQFDKYGNIISITKISKNSCCH